MQLVQLVTDNDNDNDTGALTAESLYRQHWYAVPDDEVGGWAIATVNRPTSQIDPMTTRDRVIAWLVWEEHTRWLVREHNRALDEVVERNAAGEYCVVYPLPLEEPP